MWESLRDAQYSVEWFDIYCIMASTVSVSFPVGRRFCCTESSLHQMLVNLQNVTPSTVSLMSIAIVDASQGEPRRKHLHKRPVTS